MTAMKMYRLRVVSPKTFKKLRSVVPVVIPEVSDSFSTSSIKSVFMMPDSLAVVVGEASLITAKQIVATRNPKAVAAKAMARIR